jgi:hypothetical protein
MYSFLISITNIQLLIFIFTKNLIYFYKFKFIKMSMDIVFVILESEKLGTDYICSSIDSKNCSSVLVEKLNIIKYCDTNTEYWNIPKFKKIHKKIDMMKVVPSKIVTSNDNKLLQLKYPNAQISLQK